MKFFDTHTHANFNVFKNDSKEVVERALENGVWMINVGSQASTSKRAVEMAQNYQEGVYAAVGLHPSHLEDEIFDEEFYLELAKNEKVVAIGECGLDYAVFVREQKGERLQKRASAEAFSEGGLQKEIDYRKKKQKEVFIKHIELAKKIDKPVIIHCRDAHDDLIEILKANSSKLKDNEAGVMHFFTGAYEQAKQYIDLGFYISFSGVITFASEYEELVKKLPLDRILIETDAPYAAPAPYRGKRNEPSYVVEVARKLAEIKNISFDEAARQTTENAKIVFGL
ncbi:MAG: TatD family hydrolase, partial [Patescibacteria group bacterium]